MSESDSDSPINDLIADVERVFDVGFTADEKNSLKTLGDVYSLVLRRYANVPTRGGCVRTHVFYRVRRALIDGAGIARNDIKLDTDLRLLMPRRFRRQLWCSFTHRLPWNSEVLYLRYPKLFATTFGTMLVVTFFGLFPAIFCAFKLGLVGILILLATLGVFLLSLGVLASETHNPIALEIGETFDTPRKITNYLAAWNYGKMAKEFGDWNAREVWDMLRKLVQDSFSVNPSEITEERELEDLAVCCD